MNENTIEGAVKSGAGKLERGVGEAAGNGELKADGAAKNLEGQARRIIGSAQEAVNHAAEGAKSAVSQVGGQARELYGRAQDRAKSVGGVVEPFVQDKPYAALAVAGAAGVVLGMLLAGRGPRVVYVKPRG